MLKRDSRLGQYKIVRFLGEGGMGAVYEAVHTELGKRVALKTLRSDVETLPTVKERFLREGQAAARIKHPHIVDVYDAGQCDGVAFLVMEFLDGEDLETLLRRETRVSTDRALDILIPVMAAVAAVHQQGIIHRDLKPQNVFLTRGPYGEPLPKVLDFGISKVATGDAALTGAGEALGSPYYMSPEQARGITDLSARSDQFGLGVILYELLTGVRPFDAPNVIAVLFAIQQGEFVPLHDRLPGTPRALSEAVSRALAKDPGDRFPTVLDLARALLPFAGERTRVLWSPLLGTSSQGAALEDDRPLIAAEDDRTKVRRNPMAETGPRPAVDVSGLKPDEVTRPPVLRPPTDPRARIRPATPPPPAPAPLRPPTDPRGRVRPATPPPGSAEPRQTTPAPGRQQLRPSAEASRTGSRPAAAATSARKATGSFPAPRPERQNTPPPPSRPASPRTPALPQQVIIGPARTGPIKSTAAAQAAQQRRRRQTREEMPFDPEPFSTPGFERQDDVTDPPPVSRRGVEEFEESDLPGMEEGPGSDAARQETAQLQVWQYELLCISQGDPGATLRARQLIRTSKRLVMLFEAKVPSPEKKAPLVHVLNSTHGALDVVAIVDDGKGGWRDPYGDLCKELVPLRYDAKNAYVMLHGGAFQQLIRKDLFDPLSDAEKITDWVAGRNPVASRWKRPKDD